MDRAEAIKKIKTALQKRSGKTWSVTGGKGTAYGWLTIDAPPARRTWHDTQTATTEPPTPAAQYRGASCVTPGHRVGPGAEDPILSPADDPWATQAAATGYYMRYNWEHEYPKMTYGHMSPEERVELGKLLGLGEPVHFQGHSVPSGNDFYEEYVARAEGRTPTRYGSRDWD
jgi:hypothetical protein